MKKLLLSILLVSLCASSVSAKMLVLTSNKTGVVGALNVFDRLAKTRGLDYDVVQASDTTAVWARAISGDYTSAMLVSLPTLSASYDTEGELAAAGWTYVSMYINRNSEKKFPIPLIVPLVYPMPTTNAWAVDYTGQMALIGAQALDAQSLTDANGDTVYVNMHSSGAGTLSRIADSLSWVEAMVWSSTPVAATTQKYATMWRTIGTGNHQVVYVLGTNVSYGQTFYAAAMGLFEKCSAVEVAPLCLNYGYVGSGTPTGSGVGFGTSVDTVSFGYNLNRLVKDVVVPNGIKLDFLVDTYSMDNQNKANIKTIITLAAAYPDNVRMTHTGERGWGVVSNRDWTGYETAGTYSQMVKRMTRSQDSVALHYTMDSNRMYAAGPGPGGGYAGTWTSPYDATVCVKTDSVLRAIVDSDIRDIYVVGNQRAGQMRPTAVNYGIIGAGRTWIGESYKELRMFPIVYPNSLSTIHTTTDTLRLAYGARAPFKWKALRGTYASQMFNYILGVRAIVGSTSSALINTANRTPRAATPGPGIGFPAGLLTGGSRLVYAPYLYASIDSSRSIFSECLEQLDQQVQMCNYLVSEYGTSGTPAYQYTWLNEIKLDRKLNRAFVNSHVRHE